MTKIKKSEKIIRWASEKRVRDISHVLNETGQSEDAFFFMLGRLRRNGLVTFERIGRKVKLNLTQFAYYNRSVLVNAR